MRPLKLLPRRLDRRARRKIASRIVRAAAALGMHEPILWVNDPGGAEVSRLTGWQTLYDMTDDWLAAQRPAAELHASAAQETTCSPTPTRSWRAHPSCSVASPCSGPALET